MADAESEVQGEIGPDKPTSEGDRPEGEDAEAEGFGEG